MTREYRICTRCVMDTSDPGIFFDQAGVCNHCHQYDRIVSRVIFAKAEMAARLGRIVERISRDGRGKSYDCIIGVSGGVDSTYVAYLVKKELGLRPLAVHLDNGWDSELAVKNIENTVKKLDIDLYTHVIDWDEFKDLQVAFLKASTPDSEIPSDHAILALMHRMASRYRLRYVLPGFNIRTESHLPTAWSQGHGDWRYIRHVHKRFGKGKLTTFPHMTFLEHKRYLLTQEWIHVLNYVEYAKKNAIATLERELGWKYYGGKHYESIYTRFYQGYILPRKFGFDKRRTHLSSLLCSGEISRDEAIRELQTDTYPAKLQEEDRVYVIKKLGLSEEEFGEIMRLPLKGYHDYPSYHARQNNRVYKAVASLYLSLRGASRDG